MDNKTNEPLLELDSTEMQCVAGGDFLGWLTGLLQSGSDTSTPASNAGLGIRG
jgi:hypothetical protein